MALRIRVTAAASIFIVSVSAAGKVPQFVNQCRLYYICRVAARKCLQQQHLVTHNPYSWVTHNPYSRGRCTAGLRRSSKKLLIKMGEIDVPLTKRNLVRDRDRLWRLRDTHSVLRGCTDPVTKSLSQACRTSEIGDRLFRTVIKRSQSILDQTKKRCRCTGSGQTVLRASFNTNIGLCANTNNIRIRKYLDTVSGRKEELLAFRVVPVGLTRERILKLCPVSRPSYHKEIQLAFCFGLAAAPPRAFFSRQLVLRPFPARRRL